MKDIQAFFQDKKIRIVDHSNPATLGTAMASFAADDTLCQTAGRNANEVATRFWVHDHTVVLGILDTRLPNMEEALAFLRKQGFDVVVRNSGGLAVVLDAGVLNFSFVFADTKEMGIHSGYELMTAFIQELFRDYTSDVKAYEIVGSYCPGDYDLSISGKKFAGISQRRVKKGIAVQIYLCIEGSGRARADLVRQFYALGQAIEDERFSYPVVEPDTMRSLTELLGVEMTVADVQKRVVALLREYGAELIECDLDEDELNVFEKRMHQMVDRNNKALG
ncbi:biotin/lipoate A/B protein ligase family protein [Gracilibacillus sp. YIM 98692]|uniref:lipoate--protein ligase family protein n=1 Tax=Gracilibacillus sp. YIM 98692 TaxID=2663532 RepID=UPI0013D4D12F|nr:biotin/lipoate A/B protein ligase family protein [Gracilibacillus sp. YIM 98692]